MTTHTKLRLGAVAFVIVVLFLLSGAHLCGVALKHGVDPGAKPIGGGAFACTEFWFNRYQTLIGAIATLTAGWLAFSGAIKQVKAAHSQINLLQMQINSESAGRLMDEVAYASSINTMMVKTASEQLKSIDLFNQINEKAHFFSKEGSYDTEEIVNDSQQISGELNRSINAMRDAIAEAKKLLDRVGLAKASHEAAVRFFESASTECQKLTVAKANISRQSSKQNLWEIRLNADMQYIEASTSNREADVKLVDLAEYAIVATEFGRLRELRDRAAIAAEARNT